MGLAERGWMQRLRDLLPAKGLCFSRPLLLLQSDDWGLCGIRDEEGFRELQARGLDLGNRPYDFYSLETAEDLRGLYAVLLRHRDSIGRPPCMVFNFVLCNVDFPRTVDSGFAHLKLLPLKEGLPGRWERPGLWEAYKEGIERGLVYPALHGLTHFCYQAAEKLIRMPNEEGELLRNLYRAHTPFIPGRTPWVGYEYRGANKVDGWLDRPEQARRIMEGRRLFEEAFGFPPLSACAPGYRANEDTRRGWARAGICISQNGPDFSLAPYRDRNGILMLERNVLFEPALDPTRFTEERALQAAGEALASGRPAVVCMHSVNFHSTLKNYRDLTLSRLDRFLSLLEKKFEGLLYVHDGDMLRIALEAKPEWRGEQVALGIAKRLQPSPWLEYYREKIRWVLKSLKIKLPPR